MKVSIIIPCYNQAHFLPDAIESALEQTYHNVEIIVVNDGSPDNTSEVARRYPVKLIEQKNKGLSGARNAGIKAAKGEYILPLDADDKIHPDFIMKTIGKNDIVSTSLRCFGKQDREWVTYMTHPEYQHFLQRNQINCCALFKREVWETVKGYDENMRIGFEDWDFWRRATYEGYGVTVVKEVLFYYRKHSKSMFSDAMTKREQIINYMLTKESRTGKIIDIVYVLGTGSISMNNEIRFSLRSLEKYVTGWRNVYIIGERPKWIKDVIYHKVVDKSKQDHCKALNILEKIKFACNLPDLSDEFLFINDDHFFTDYTDAAAYDYYYADEEMTNIIENRPNTDNYRSIINKTTQIWPKTHYFDIHKPIRYNKNTFLAMCDAIDFNKSDNGYLIKTSYCNFAKVKGVYSPDCIIRKKMNRDEIDKMTLFTDVFSIHDEAINKDLINYFDQNYPIPSRFE